tara:strand:- start:45 stop:260 length:216 start_codon:yes stop_codon:yes gene_type:complete
MKDLSNNVILCTWIFFGVVAFSTPNSKEYTGDYTSVANKQEKGLYGLKYMFKKEIPEQSNTQWGDINNPSY